MDLTAKERGRNKLFRCFRSTVTDDVKGGEFVKPNSLGGSEDPVLAYIAVDRGGGGCKKSVVIPKFLKSISGRCKTPSDGDVANEGGYIRQGSSRRRFSRVLKAVWFETSPAHKIRWKNTTRNSFKSSSSSSCRGENISKITTWKQSELNDVATSNLSRSSSILANSNTASTSASSSRTSSINSSGVLLSGGRGGLAVLPASSITTKPGQDNLQSDSQKKVSRPRTPKVGFPLLLLCLLVLIVWGKFCAIVCTLTWLVLASPRLKCEVSPSSDVYSDEHKKRVVLVGLLDRHRNPK